MGQKVCGPRCAVKQIKQGKAEERAKIRTRKEAIKTLPVLKAEAQREFNAFIRERDKGQPCISCGKPLPQEVVGGGFDAGHYRSVGSAPQLRYDERNVHGQCKQCNRWGSGMYAPYRIGLIGRIGKEAVEALDADNAVRKFKADELRDIRDTYRAKARELKKMED